MILKDNVVWLDKNHVVHAVFHGSQNRDRLRDIVVESERICTELIEQDLPVLMLADIRDMGGHKLDARLVGIRARVQLPFWRLAIVVPKIEDANATISRKLTAMSSRKQEIAYFITLHEAYQWLDEARADQA